MRVFQSADAICGDSRSMSTDIEIEDFRTWPVTIQNTVRQHKELILNFREERKRIDRACQEDMTLRFDPPANEWKEEYQSLVDHLEPILFENRIIGYHCTRLTSEEIGEIKSGGLSVLSPDLVRNRLERLYSNVLLSEQEYAYLTTSTAIQQSLNDEHGQRTGLLWFCPNRSTLAESSGVYRLFRSWGGEALYWGHEEDTDASHVLRRIGTPCIVKCAIPFRVAEQFHINFAERFLSQYVRDEIEFPEPTPGFDMHTTTDVPASGILEIIEHANPAFEALTRCSTWMADHAIME